jgi:hypothetical protein
VHSLVQQFESVHYVFENWVDSHSLFVFWV